MGKKSFRAEINNERHGIKLIEWNESEKTLLIQSAEDSKLLRLGSQIVHDSVSNNETSTAETDRKYQTALDQIPELQTLNHELEEIIAAKTILDKEFRQITVSSPVVSPREFIELRNQVVEEGNDARQRGDKVITEILHILENEAGFSTAELREIRSNLWSRLVQLPK